MQRVWLEKDTHAISELFRPDGTAEGLGDNMIGPEDFKGFHSQLLALIDDVKVEVKKHHQDGSWSSVLCTLDCTKKDDPSEHLSITGSIFVRIEDDTIVEAYNHFDFLSLFEKLQLLPEGTFAQCLSGQRLG